MSPELTKALQESRATLQRQRDDDLRVYQKLEKLIGSIETALEREQPGVASELTQEGCDQEYELLHNCEAFGIIAEALAEEAGDDD